MKAVKQPAPSKHVGFRCPDTVLEALVEQASMEHRSLSNLIVHLLTQAARPVPHHG